MLLGSSDSPEKTQGLPSADGNCWRSDDIPSVAGKQCPCAHSEASGPLMRWSYVQGSSSSTGTEE